MVINVSKNRGYCWIIDDNIYFKGYFFFDGCNTKVYRGTDAIQELKKINSEDNLSSFLTNINGSFAFIIDLGEKVLFAVDPARSIPLFFSEKNNIISDSSEYIRKLCKIRESDVNIDNLLALYTADYITNNSTVYSDIFQLDLGEYGFAYPNKIKHKKYYFHISNIKPDPKDELEETLFQMSKNVFERIRTVVAGRPVVLSMSGGYDSRYVGCMLKLAGIDDVSCYTYGKKDSFEIKQSEINAKALGYRWTCVEYSDELVTSILDDEGREYLNYCTEHEYTTYVQNYAAVRKLSEDRWFKPNSVFITGLCGDMPTGEYLYYYGCDEKYDYCTAAEHLYKLIFSRFTLDEDFHQKWINETIEVLKGYPGIISDYQTWVSAIDCYYTGCCHSRAYLNMNRIHEFFGYEWLIPCWDKELLSTWYSIPAEYRYEQKLYEEWMLGTIANKFGLNTKKTMVLYPSNPLKNKIVYIAGSVLAFASLHLNKPFRRKYDFNNFAPLELELFRRIEDKRLISYKKAGITHLLNQYILQKRYGLEVMRVAYKRVK